MVYGVWFRVEDQFLQIDAQTIQSLQILHQVSPGISFQVSSVGMSKRWYQHTVSQPCWGLLQIDAQTIQSLQILHQVFRARI